MHVPTDLNPTDRISRGMLASQILHDKLWWHGPAYLTSPVELWPKCAVSMPTKSELEEEMRPLVSLNSVEENATVFNEFSELAKLTRFVAYCFRLQNNCKLPRNQRLLTALAPKEMECALKSLVRLAQQQEFPMEVQQYTRNATETTGRIASKSPLKNLNIFMDEFGLLRIDGRLKNLDAPFDTRHPMLLPANHKLSWLIVRSIHLQTLHGGPSLLLATVRQRFWPLRGRDLARKVIRKCVTCFRCNPTPANQIMAPLPSVRLKPARAFTYAGMDYCGPFFVRPLIGRGSSVKVYVALFVCLVVKAVHLEIVADLSTAAFINAVKRFIACRGRVVEIHCDNATAFVGADRELRKLRKEFQQQFKSAEWGEYCAGNGITFRFIPERSPHFGGIWEARDMQRSVQDLWRCWSRDYVSQLHQRSKWRRPSADVRKGQLVLLKLDNYPSLQWPLGRIVETIAGSDGRVRVVVVKTCAGEYKRAVTEIAVLPIDSDNEEKDGSALSPPDFLASSKSVRRIHDRFSVPRQCPCEWIQCPQIRRRKSPVTPNNVKFCTNKSHSL
ncbi:uncharacterized protein LOC134210018 [Armigeres subalbatus]|uniref:uncharacterized protein LOC134210018 n=1 Tax=Armigeres subalbatus TaxID=124917 RepID=UPI002ED655BD